MKLEQGDAFEAKYCVWIRKHLPHYERVWATFVGNNGKGWPLAMEGITPEQEIARKKFYQAHYTFAVHAYQVDCILSSSDARNGAVKSLEDFLGEQQRLLLAVTLVGCIRDMFKKIDEALKMGGSLYHDLQDYYAQRSHILHGPRMPVRLNNGFLEIPKVALQNLRHGEWDDKSQWDSVDARSFQFFSDFCRDLRCGLFKLINDLHPKVYPAAKSRFGEHVIAVVSAACPPLNIMPFSDVSGLLPNPNCFVSGEHGA